MTVQTQYRVPAVEGDIRTGDDRGRRTGLVVGAVITLALIAAVVVAGRVAADRTTASTDIPAAVAAVPATGELNAKALADRYSTAAMTPSVRDDTGAWLHRSTAPTGELNAKALADRGATAGMTSPVRDDTGAWLHRSGGVQSGYADPDAVRTHLSAPDPGTAHHPGVILRRQPHQVP